jgi:ParB family transcriptional regulator, chromosome partitioning protein
LEDAALFAQFEHDPEAVERLENAKRWGRSLAHEAQRLRDEAAERKADAAEVERLRAEGLPVMSAQVVKEWVYPEDEYDAEHEDDRDEEDEPAEPDEPYQQYVPVWVVTDLDASGLRRRGSGTGSTTADSGDESEEEAEARREVRRGWRATFVARKTAPKGAEALICEAVVTGHHSLSKAMDHRHPMLFTLLGLRIPTGFYGAGHDECHKIATKASTPKPRP